MSWVGQLCSGRGVSDVGREPSVKESTMCVTEGPLNRNTHETRLCLHPMMEMLRTEARRNMTLYFL